jgi:hypothetical protein
LSSIFKKKISPKTFGPHCVVGRKLSTFFQELEISVIRPDDGDSRCLWTSEFLTDPTVSWHIHSCGLTICHLMLLGIGNIYIYLCGTVSGHVPV